MTQAQAQTQVRPTGTGSRENNGTRSAQLSMPNALVDLLAELHAMADKNCPQHAILARVQAVANRCGVRVRADQQNAAQHADIPSTTKSAPTEGVPVPPQTAMQTCAKSAATGASAMMDAPAALDAPAVSAAPDAPTVLDAPDASTVLDVPTAPTAPTAPDTPAAPGTVQAALDAIFAKTATSCAPTAVGTRRKISFTQPVPCAVPMVRMRDGSHKFVLSKVLDRPADPELHADEFADTLDPNETCRIVLSNDKRGGSSHGRMPTLFYECNGVVLDARTWRVLAIPPCAFNSHPRASDVDPLLADDLFDVIRVDDGTVVTLYHWMHPTNGGTWALASSNGYDVSSLHWIGPLTYAEVFFDLAQRAYPKFGAATGMTLLRGATGETTLNFASLATDRCYTIGFRHHNFHPLLADPERMWQIQCTDLSGPIPVTLYTDGLPVIPAQFVYAPPDLCRLASLAAEALGKSGTISSGKDDARPRPLSVAGLAALGTKALAKAKLYVAGCWLNGRLEAETGESLPVEIDYGFILRSKDRKLTNGFSDFLIETPLLCRVRKIAYERAPRALRNEITADDRFEYNALRAFLTSTERADFADLYPQWQPKFRAYESFVNSVLDLTIHALRQQAMAPTSRDPALNTPIGRLVKAFIDHIRANEMDVLSPFDKNTASIIRDYVVNPEYALLFLHAMRASGRATKRTHAPAASQKALVDE
jgi:hypothetical protein